MRFADCWVYEGSIMSIWWPSNCAAQVRYWGGEWFTVAFNWCPT